MLANFTRTFGSKTAICMSGAALMLSAFGASPAAASSGNRALRGHNTGANSDHVEYRRNGQRQAVGTDGGYLEIQYRYPACSVSMEYSG